MKNIKRILEFLTILLILNSVNAWEFVTVDYGNTYERDALVLDSSGNPCFIFKDNEDELLYECWNGVSFDSEIVDSDNVSGFKNFALALDNSDNPYICMVNSSNSLIYYNYSGTAFEKNVLTSGVHNPEYCNIDIDKNNNPHIVFMGDVSAGDSKNAVYEKFVLSGSWITSLVLNLNYASSNNYVPSIKISNDDFKYSLIGGYEGAINRIVKFCNASYDSSAWSCDSLYAGTTAIVTGDLAIFNNYAYISFLSNSVYRLQKQINLHNNTFTELYTPSALLSLAIQGNVYGVYISGADNMQLVTNETGAFADTTEFGDCDKVPTLAIDENGDKWILYSDNSGIENVVKLAYEKPLYTITGNIYDAVTIDGVESAYLCFTKDSEDYCDYSNSTGGYDVDLFSGAYNLLITKSGYNDYSDSGINFNSDLANNHYYINPEGVTVENESSIVLTFLHYEDNTPIILETMELKYISGCECLIGNKYYYTTNSEGKIGQTIYKGDYEIKPMGEYLIYSEWSDVYTTITFAYIDIDNYNKVFYLKPYSAVENLVYGKTKDATTGILLANMTVAIYNAYNYYEGLSNESGNYQLLDVDAGVYSIYAYDSKAPIEYDKTSEDSIIIENETEQDLYLYPKLISDELILQWNITDCSDESPLANVTTVMEDSGGLPVYYNLSGENGLAIISEIEKGWYNVSHRKSGYISQASGYNYLQSFNLSICLREMGLDICFKVNGIIYMEDGTTPLQLATFKVKNEYGTLLTYITDSTGIYDTGKEVGGRCLEEGYYTLEVSREGYNTYSELIFLDENISHNITMNESEEKITYIVIVANRLNYLPISNALVNLTEEYIVVNDSINKICYHPDSADGCIFSNLRKGHYIVEITAEGYNSEKFRKYLIGDSKSVVLLDETEPHYTLRVQVTGKEPDDNFTIGLKDADVTLSKLIDWNFPDDFEKIRTEKSGNGGFVWFDDLVKDVYRVEVEMDYYFPNQEDVFLDSDKEIEIILISSGDIIVADMSAKKEKAETEIQDFLYTYVPTFFMLLFLLFLMSALNKVTVRG